MCSRLILSQFMGVQQQSILKVLKWVCALLGSKWAVLYYETAVGHIAMILAVDAASAPRNLTSWQ